MAYQGNTASTPLWSLQDHQASIIAITDAAGAAPYTLGYDEYGQPRAGNAGRLMYTGQLWLPDWGLYHYKARAYHPGLGRFVQTDPVGYEQGMNLYAYVGLDPMNKTDPSGRIMGACPWCDDDGEIVGVENLPPSEQIILQAYDGNAEVGPQNPFYGTDIVSDYVTAYVFANVSAAVVAGGEAKLGSYAVTDLRTGEIVETGFMVGGVAGFGGDVAIGGGFQVSPGAPVDGITFVAQGSVGSVTGDSQGGTGIAVSPIPLPASGLAGIQVQKHFPMYRSKNWTRGQ